MSPKIERRIHLRSRRPNPILKMVRLRRRLVVIGFDLTRRTLRDFVEWSRMMGIIEHRSP